MSKAKRIGKCHLCGETKELTREHVPPQKAYNNATVLLYKIDSSGGSSEVSFVPDGSPAQGGHWTYTLCRDCNSKTGGWYGRAYVEFAQACARYDDRSYADGVVSVPGPVFPLRVMKQALVIMCSSCGPGLTEKNPDLRRLLLGKTGRGLLPPLRLFAYVKCDHGGRSSGISSVTRVDRGQTLVIAEFAWWPLGLVLAFKDATVDEAADLSHWLDYDYDAQIPGPIELPCRWAGTPSPLDYRSPEQVLKEAQTYPR